MIIIIIIIIFIFIYIFLQSWEQYSYALEVRVLLREGTI